MKYLILTATIIISLLSFWLGCLYFGRVFLDYNSEGRYYSVEEGTVYLEQTCEVFGVLTIVGIVISSLLVICSYRYFKKRENK